MRSSSPLPADVSDPPQAKELVAREEEREGAWSV
jgi:hypothetical protein